MTFRQYLEVLKLPIKNEIAVNVEIFNAKNVLFFQDSKFWVLLQTNNIYFEII